MAERIIINRQTFWLETCCCCNVPFAMTDEVHAVALQRREKALFWCPNGHQQHYVTGDTVETKLRRERDRLQQRIAEEHENSQREFNLRLAVERREAKLKRRINGGVCPCCNRHFIALQRHVKTKHPQFAAENVVPLKATAASRVSAMDRA